MDNLSIAIDFCEVMLKSNKNWVDKVHLGGQSPQKKPFSLGTYEGLCSPRDTGGNNIPPPSIVNRIDIENLMNYVQIWTDIIEHNIVNQSYDVSNFQSLRDFERANHLYNLGFFYVKINSKISILEFFGLLTKIPWENLQLPGMNQIPFQTITQLFGNGSDKIAIQLMVLGDFFKFWKLINPYDQMTQTSDFVKLMLSGMGNLSIFISPNFIKHCQEMIETIDLFVEHSSHT